MFHGPNSGYILELYDRYVEDPSSVDPEARALFDSWKPDTEDGAAVEARPQNMDKILGTANLAQAIRAFGHLDAKINPLGIKCSGDPSLEPATHGINEEDLFQLPSSLIGGP